MGEIHFDKFGVLRLVKFDFMTMNNKIDPSKLDINKGESASIINMFPTVRGSVFVRDGYTLVNATSAIGSWSNDKHAYLLNGSNLCHFDGTTVKQIANITPLPIYDFLEVNDVCLFSNGVDYLILEGDTASLPVVPTDNFKVQPVAGISLEFYNGRVYVASGNAVYCLDPFSVDQMDERQCLVAAFECPVTMVKRVDNGIYIATEKELFFLSGDDPYSEQGVNLEVLASTTVIAGTAIRTNGDKFPSAEMQGSLVVFATTDGVFVGGNSGSFKNLSFDKISYANGDYGSAMVCEKNGNVYYVVSFVSSGLEKNKYVIPLFEVDQQEV